MKTTTKFLISLLILIIFWSIIKVSLAENKVVIKGKQQKQVKVVKPEIPPKLQKTLDHIKKNYTPEQIKVVNRIVELAGDTYPDYLIRLAWCESRFNPRCKHPNGRYGLDRGLFEINNKYHPEVSDKCAYSVDCSTGWTIKRIKDGQQGIWACDRIIKGKTLQELERIYK